VHATALNTDNKKKVAFYTLGCKLNFAETSSIGRTFEDNGFLKVDFYDTPNIYVINTCSVTDNADKKCRKIVNDALSVSPHAYIIVIGCYAQLKPEEIAQIPGVDTVLGASEKFDILNILNNFEKKDKASIHVTPVKEARTFVPSYSLGDRTRTFLKVQDGCNYNCSFCTIPLARGKSRSSPIDHIVAQAHEIARSGVKEIVLTGVNIGDYGILDGRRSITFLDLIRVLDAVDGISRFRISSIEPNLLTNDIISFVAASKRFVPHFHIPLQSGSDKILQIMRRRYLTSLYAERVDSILSLMPNCCIGVDVIVGFPGETEEEFLTTYDFLNKLSIAYLHVFPYSERDNTHAISIADVVPHEVRAQRAKMLRILSEKKLRAFYEKYLGTIGNVLFERERENDLMFGFTDNYIRVSAPYDETICNTIQAVQLLQIDTNGVVCGRIG
jgi:threonylcarbamoyladenosine tRNA methylthiotransferase MtaB